MDPEWQTGCGHAIGGEETILYTLGAASHAAAVGDVYNPGLA